MSSTCIRYKVVGGREGEDLCISEAEALETLTKTLDEYTRRGYRISHFGDEYVVEDRGGDLVATYELMH
jgi:hypothetical protein